MPLYPAGPADLPAVAALVNSAYRGESSRRGWTTEADLIGGQRTDPGSLAADLAASPGARLLVLREAPDGAPLGCVWLEPADDAAIWHLGMLTIRPDLQASGRGRELLAAAEAAAKALGAWRIRMSVIALRAELIAWYGRRGYAPTGATRPFPYGDPRLGEPRRDDLSFLVLEKRL